MRLNLKEVLKGMSEQEVYDIVRAAKNELEERLARDSVYEPMGIPEKDQKHYQRMQMLRDMLAQL